MMSEKKKMKTGRFVLLCIAAFIVVFIASAVFKIKYTPRYLRKYSAVWSDEIGTIKKDLPYGDGAAQKFDLYLPKNSGKDSYSLVVYLHPGGFTSGDKADDINMHAWLCSKGYVSCGINYTLFSDENPNANVYTQSMEIKESIPHVIEACKGLGYNIENMAIAGGSAGHCLAMLCAYRDAAESPVPVRLVFGAVGPSSFYPEDWKCYGLDKNSEAAAGIFTIMTGQTISEEMFGTKEYDELVKPASALLWIDENSVPSVFAYGVYDKVQPYEGALRLDEALTQNGVDHAFFKMLHSGHGLQNDNKVFAEYKKSVEEYLEKYIPVD